MSKEDELRDVLKEAASEIAQAQSNSRTWQSWIIYFLNQLEEQSTSNNPDKASFTELLSALQDAIRNRLKTGGW